MNKNILTNLRTRDRSPACPPMSRIDNRTVEYVAWQNMVQRCTNPKFHSYVYYGARGITIYPEWIGRGGYLKKVATWTVIRSDTGVLEYDCPSIGYPLPYDTGLTNPLKRMYGHNGGGIVEQAEPNGLFSSKNSIATWVRCVVTVNDKDVEAPLYFESRVTAFPFPVDVNYETGRVTPVADAAPSITIKEKKQ